MTLPAPRPVPDPAAADLTPGDVARALRRHWRLALAVTAAGLLAATAWVRLTRPVWRATTTLQFDERRGASPLLQSLQALEDGSEVSTEMEVLRSRVLSEQVVDELALAVDLVEPGRTPRSTVLAEVRASRESPAGEVTLDADSAITHAGLEVRPAPGATADGPIVLEVSTWEEALRRFEERRSISRPSREAGVVAISVEHTDPVLARDGANLLTAAYLARRNRVQKTADRSTVEFLRQQLDTLRGQLARAEAEVQSFREREQVVSLRAEAESQVAQLAALRAQRVELGTEREALAELHAAATAGGGADAWQRLLAFPTLYRNQATAALLEALTTLGNERAALLSRRTPDDPDVVALDQRMDILRTQAQDVVTTYLSGLTNQIAAVDRELGRFGAQLEAVPGREVEYARRERQARVLEEIVLLLQTRLKEAEVAEAVQDGSVRVLDPAVLPRRPVRPRPMVLLPLAGILAAGLGGLLAVARDRSDRTLRSRAAVEQATGLPAIGVIPHVRGLPSGSRLRLPGPGGHTATTDALLVEAVGALRTNLLFLKPEGGPRRIAITSALPGEGKSFASLELARSLARQGLRVVVVDGDLRRGRLHEALGLPERPGLSELLADLVPATSSVLRDAIIDGAPVQVIPRGAIPPNPSELFSRPRLGEILVEAGTEADFVVVDCPPLLPVTDAALLARQADGTLLVARAGETDGEALREAIERLRAVHAPVLGVVLNGVDPAERRYYGGYHAYARAPRDPA